MTPLVAWYTADQEGDIPIESAADLDAVLDQAATLVTPGWPVLITLSTPGDLSSPVLYVGLHGEVGALLHVSVEFGQEFSRNNDVSPEDEPLLYMYQTSDNEFPPNSEIPIELVRRAAHHFLRTHEKLPDVTWSVWNWEGNVGESDYGDLL
jgi:hypothetical protein